MDATERNQKIIAMHADGASLRKCGVAFGLTHERVRQILRENGVNRRFTRRANKSGFRGVYPHGKGYMALIAHGGKSNRYLGSFASAEEAARAYDAAAIERFGTNAILNFPPQSQAD